jgi:hypothetical protein
MAMLSSCGRAGERVTIFWNCSTRFRDRPCEVMSFSSLSGTSSTLALRYGSDWTISTSRTLWRPCKRMCMLPSGVLSIFPIPPAVPIV